MITQSDIAKDDWVGQFHTQQRLENVSVLMVTQRSFTCDIYGVSILEL